jgi:hypothetical protein
MVGAAVQQLDLDRHSIDTSIDLRVYAICASAG